MQIWIVLLPSVVSGLLGVIISTIYYQRAEKRKIKLDTLRKLAATRYALTGKGTESSKAQFFEALNESHIVYHDAPDVQNRLEKLHNELNQPGKLDDNLVNLFKSIFDNLGIKGVKLNDSYILKPFTPGGIIQK
ncbi:MAG: hypothetical protein L6263_12775 [Desulfobacteraceae bacterium]|nr:hypothetical protein [Desulfobacteraceae bacterium]